MKDICSHLGIKYDSADAERKRIYFFLENRVTERNKFNLTVLFEILYKTEEIICYIVQIIVCLCTLALVCIGLFCLVSCNLSSSDDVGRVKPKNHQNSYEIAKHLEGSGTRVRISLWSIAIIIFFGGRNDV